VRTLNYTGRQRLRHADVNLTVKSGSDGKECTAAVDFSDIKQRVDLPDEASVVLEAFNGNSIKFARFDLGTVAEPRFGDVHRLNQFSPDEVISFRLKVVRATGVIIALADGIKLVASEEGQNHSLLPVSVEPLDGQVYRVDFPEGEQPTLVLNEILDSATEQGIKAFARSAMFVSLVFPAVVKEILTRILFVDGSFEHDDREEGGAEWVVKWIRFARALNPEPIPSADDGEREMMAWIEAVVSEFGRRQNVVQRCEQALTGGR
jgi:hypothetical protein